MHFPTLASIAAVLVTCPINVLGGETYVPPPMSVSSSLEYPTTTPAGYPASSPTGCVTITETEGPSCPALTCARPDCIQLKTVTLGCSCASIYSTTECATTCGGCQTSYDTVYLPCATSLGSSSSGYETTTTTSTSTSYSASPPPTYPTYPTYPMTSWANSTMTTTTISIVTIPTCPASCTCTGQTTTWSGTTGPTTCPASSTCSCVLPGGPMTTVTTPGGEGPAPTTTPAGNTSPTPTTTPSGSPTQVQAGGAGKVRFGLADGGILVGLIGAIIGMLEGL